MPGGGEGVRGEGHSVSCGLGSCRLCDMLQVHGLGGRPRVQPHCHRFATTAQGAHSLPPHPCCCCRLLPPAARRLLLAHRWTRCG